MTMTGFQELLLGISATGVIIGFFKYHGLLNELNELREQHDIHNKVIERHEIDISDLKPKMTGAFVDIAGLYIGYGKLNERVGRVEKQLDIVDDDEIDVIKIMDELDPTDAV